MALLRKQSLPFRGRYLFIAVIAVLVLVITRSMSVNEGLLRLSPNHLLLQLYYYATWGSLIYYLNGSVVLRINLQHTPLNEVIRMINSALLIIAFHFTFSNLMYFSTVLVVTSKWTFTFGGLNEYLLPGLISRSVDLLVIVAILKLIDNNRQITEKNMKMANLEKQMQQSQLSALQAQLNPHFLFNSLHAVSSLIGYDDQKARNMTIKISGLLRKMLDNDEKLEHSIEDEMNYIHDYLEIEKERFHDRLVIEVSVQEDVKDQLVPKLLLQPLIENAFKHGISQIEGKGQIKLLIEGHNEYIFIKVSNDVPESRNLSMNMGIGISNLRERLIQTYDRNDLLDIDSEGKEFIVSIKLPLRS